MRTNTTMVNGKPHVSTTQHYEWDVNRWRQNRDLEADGDGLDATWPETASINSGATGLGAEREGQRCATYLLRLTGDDDGKPVDTTYALSEARWREIQDRQALVAHLALVGVRSLDTLEDDGR